MTGQPPLAAEQRQTAPTSEPQEASSDKGAGSPAQRPYLKVFGPDIGVFEHELSEAIVTIGRHEHADVRLPHLSVSRAHATITASGGQYTIKDMSSNCGTEVNRQRIETHTLVHGDSIQIGSYVLQFRTHRGPPGATAAAARAKKLLHSNFCMLPSTMRLKIRTLEVAPQQIFAAGDTLAIGQGGLLVPTPTSPGDCACLEMHLTWPSGASKRYLGEIMGVLEEESTHWMCIKLHTVSKSIYQATVECGKPGPWIDVIAT